MSLYKPKGTKKYHIRFSIGGKKVRKSAFTSNRKEAEEYEQELRNQIWREMKLGARPDYTFDKLAKEWLGQSTKKSRSTDANIMKWLGPRLTDKRLSEITSSLILEIRNEKKAESSASTANRHMALLRAMLNAAVRWGWIEIAPYVPMYKAKVNDPRWITKKEFARLEAELPHHLAAMALFAVNTGLRKTPLTELKWSWVDLENDHISIPAQFMKDGKSFGIPLNEWAKAALESVLNENPEYVFTYKGHKITQTNTKAWGKALKRAEIENFRWHDLRSTWASWHVMAGTPLPVLQRLGPWKSYEMVLRYAHLAPDHVASYAGNIV